MAELLSDEDVGLMLSDEDVGLGETPESPQKPSPFPEEIVPREKLALSRSEAAKLEAARQWVGEKEQVAPPSTAAEDYLATLKPSERAKLEDVTGRVQLSEHFGRVQAPVTTGLRESAVGAAETMATPAGMGLLGATVAAPEAMAPVWAGMGVHGIRETVPQIHKAIQEGDRPAYYKGVFDLGQQALMLIGGVHGAGPRAPVPLPRTMEAAAEARPEVPISETIPQPEREVPSALPITEAEKPVPSLPSQPAVSPSEMPAATSTEGIRGGPPTEEAAGRGEVPITEAPIPEAAPAISPTVEGLRRELEHLQGGEVTDATLARSAEIVRELRALEGAKSEVAPEAPVGEVGKPKEPPQFTDWLHRLMQREAKRLLSESEGTAILIDAEDAGRNPDQIAREFFENVYPTLSQAQKAKLDAFFKASTGFAPGDVLGTKPGPEGTRLPFKAESWLDIIPSSIDANTIEQLQGTDRGLVAVMEYGNEAVKNIRRTEPRQLPETAGEKPSAVVEPQPEPQTITGREGEKAPEMPAGRGAIPRAARRPRERPFDIVDAIQSHIGGKLSLDYARRFREGYKPTGVARKLFSRQGEYALDTTLDTLHREGLFRNITSEDELMDAIDDAVAARKGRGKVKTAEEKEIARQETQRKDFETTALRGRRRVGEPKGTEPIKVNELLEGDEFTIAGVKVKVKELVFDRDTDELANVVLEDGRRFEVQTVGPDQILKVDEGTIKKTPPPPAAPVGKAVQRELLPETPFNLAGEVARAPEAKPELGGTPGQIEMFDLQKVVASVDPAKSADAASQMYGGPRNAITTLQRQLRVIDSDPITRQQFVKEQRDRLKAVISLLEQRASAQPSPIVGEGPGAAPRGFGPYPAIKQLQDQLKAAPKVGTRERIAWGERKAELWAQGKNVVDHATARIVNVSQAIREIARGVTNVTDLERRVGEYDWAIQQSAGMSKAMKEAMLKQMKNVTDREAAAVLIDSARIAVDPRNPADVRQVIVDGLAVMPPETKPPVRRAFERALDPSLEVRQFTESLKQYFGLREQDAIDADLFEQGLRDYYTHVWKDERNMPGSLVTAFTSGKVSTYFRSARERKLSTFVEGIMQGKTPVLDPVEVIPNYNFSMDRAIASRTLVESFNRLTGSDGRPLVEPLGGSASPNPTSGPVLIKPKLKTADMADYKAVDHPAMRKWKWVQDVDGRPVVVQGDLVVHPEAYKRLSRMMDKHVLTPHPVTKAALTIGAEVKGLKLGAVPSGFHLMHVGSHALLHWTNPFKFSGRSWMSEGAINWEHPFTRYAVEKGHIKIGVDPHELSIFNEGLAISPLARTVGNFIKVGPFKFGDWSHGISSWLFEDYIPKLKLATFENAFQRAEWAQRKLGLFKGLNRDQIAARTGDAVNNAYGEMNHLFLGKAGRHPGFQRALRLAFLAPDFGEARLRFVGKALTRYGHEERLALMALATVGYFGARLANYLGHGDPEWDFKNALRVKSGDKWYSMRSVAGDIIHALSNWRQFTYVRLNPATSQRVWDLAAGRDVNTGRKLTWGDQLKRATQTVLPIQLSGLTREDQTFMQGFNTSMFGVTAANDWAEQDVRSLALDWNNANSHPPPAEFVPNDTPTYNKLRLALRVGRASLARDLLNDLRKTRSDKQIEHFMGEYVEHPFTGSNERENQFIGTLSIKQRRLYVKARQERVKDITEFYRLLAHNPRKQ